MSSDNIIYSIPRSKANTLLSMLSNSVWYSARIVCKRFASCRMNLTYIVCPSVCMCVCKIYIRSITTCVLRYNPKSSRFKHIYSLLLLILLLVVLRTLSLSYCGSAHYVIISNIRNNCVIYLLPHSVTITWGTGAWRVRRWRGDSVGRRNFRRR